MGGRGARSAGGNAMNVPYDQWGKRLEGADVKDVLDKDGNVIGKIEDEERYDSVPDIRKATLADVKKDIEAWKMDDGTYGDADTSIFVQYADGSYWTNDMDKKLKKTGIIGAAISTADYEMVAGYEINKGKKTPMQTWSEDGESGLANSYSGYKATEKWIERVKTTYNTPSGHGGYKTVRQVIRKSTAKPVNKYGY